MIDPRRKVLDPREREEVRMIGRLQSMNIYAQLVRRLTERESVRSVARWAMTVGVEGAPSNWGFEYWRKHLHVLRSRVIEAKEKMLRDQRRERRTGLTQPPAAEAVLAKVNETTENAELLDFISSDALNIMKHVVGAEKQLKAIHVLQYQAIKQIGRVERMEKMEKSMPFMMPNGHHEMRVLTGIASALTRLELGHEMIRGRRGYMPQIAGQETEMSPWAKRMMEFDEVDRSLLRELSANFIEMVQGETSGRFEAAGLEADATGEVGAVHREQPGDIQPPVDEGS